MKYGHRLKVKITGYDDHGLGMSEAEIAPNEIRPIAVPFSCKGDGLDVIFIKRDHKVKICRIEKIEKPGEQRVDPKCAHAGICGGCLWQSLEYKAQLEEKENGVKKLFNKLGLADRVRPIVPAEQTWGYRNRMDYCVGWNGEIGLKEYGAWNRYLDIKECPLLSDQAGQILEIAREWMKTFDLEPWDAKFHTGNFRYVVIRVGKNTHELMVNFVVFDKSKISQEAKDWLIEKLPSHTSLLLSQQNKATDISLSQDFEVLKGNLFLTEQVNGITYRIHPNSFFQTNSDMASSLQDCVLSAIQPPLTSSRARSVAISDSSISKQDVPKLEIAAAAPRNDKLVLLDLYCGLGFFGIAAAKKYPGLKVYGHELDEPAIELAKENAKLNGVDAQCEFRAGKAEDLSWASIKADAIIVDPPRSGLHPRVIKALCQMKPEKLIYVSCNYHRFESELPELLKTFELASVTPIDLFPNTAHVEVVAVMHRT